MDYDAWLKLKQRRMEALEEAKSKGFVDQPIMGLIDKINKHPNYFTTSSCSGRILLFRTTEKKHDACFIFKWHRQVSEKELLCAIDSIKNKDNVFLRVEPFVLHVCCSDLEAASNFLKFSRMMGVKKGGVQSFSPKIMVELMGNNYLSVPLFCCDVDQGIADVCNGLLAGTHAVIKKMEDGFDL